MILAFLIACAVTGPPESDGKLDSTLRKYFLETDKAAQRRLEDEICATPKLTCGQLAKAIRAVQLWDAQKTGQYEVRLRLGEEVATDKQVWLSVPADYDAAKSWPLIVTYHGQGGQARDMLMFTRQLLK